MKKQLIIITLIFIIIMTILTGILFSNSYNLDNIKRENKEYEQYLGEEILGTEVATIINKVIDQNEKNNVVKNKNGFYADNGINSIKIDLKMTTIKRTFQMEAIYNQGIEEFVKNFNFIEFKCSDIYYHKDTGKVSKIIFEEIEE